MGPLLLPLIAACVILIIAVLLVRKRPVLHDARRKPTAPPAIASQIIDATPHAVVITNARGIIQTVNRAFSTITGYDSWEAVGKNPNILKSGRHDSVFYAKMWRSLRQDGRWEGEVWNRRKSGEIYPEWLSITAIRSASGQVCNYVGVFSDIEEAKISDAKTLHMAFHDELTGLPKRTLLIDRIEQAIARAQRNNRLVAVMFADLDNFKRVNDSFGHSIGDLLLRMTAGRLRAKVRAADTVSRIGGDEFAILIEDLGSAREVEPRARDIVEAMAMPMRLDGQPVQVGLTLGVAFYPTDGENADELLESADHVMYRAKREGKGGYCFCGGTYVPLPPH